MALVCSEDQTGYEREECGQATCIAGRCERDLLAYFTFDEASGTTTVDAANKLTGRLEKGANFVDSGRLGSAVSFACEVDGKFDGNEANIDLGNILNDSIQYPISVAAWLYFEGEEDPRPPGMVFTTDDEGTFCGVSFWMSPSAIGLLTGKCDGRTGTSRRNFNHKIPDPIPTAQWTHVAAVAPSATEEFSFYVNGDHVATGIESDGSFAGEVVTTTSPARIGAGHNNSNSHLCFNGRIDELKVYGRALTGPDVKALHESY